MENFIQLKEDNILRIGIKDTEGNDTGEYLEFDMEDIELPLKLNQCEKEHYKNVSALKNQYAIIDKQEDKKGKYVLSWKDEEKIKAVKEFYDKEAQALDLFLGENGTKKLLNGRRPYITMFDDISDLLEKYVLPKLDLTKDSVIKKIKSKYSKDKEEGNVLE